MATHPSSYRDLSLPDILLSHVPASSPIPTPILLITLHRPKAHNAFTDPMVTSLVQVFDLASSDARIRAIVLTGHGSIFCAGADLTTGLSYANDTPEGHRDGGGQVALAIHNCQKPVIAAINGHAVGVGITMTLPANIRVVSEKAKIGFVFARRGIVMEACSSYFLPRLIGYSRAMHLITTGGVYPSSHRLLSELFSEIVPPEQVLSRALEIAEEVAANTSVVSTKLMKDMMWRGPETAEGAQLLTSRLLMSVFSSRDRNEGVKSFMEKRPATFEGTMEEDAPEVWPWWQDIDVKAKL
jgi:enoyl-CoA hydratase/carnithine racemase